MIDILALAFQQLVLDYGVELSIYSAIGALITGLAAHLQRQPCRVKPITHQLSELAKCQNPTATFFIRVRPN